MTSNVDCRWLANVIAQVENQDRDQPAVQVMLTQTNRGKKCLVVNGFEYRKGKVVNGGQTQNWRCIKSTCNGSAKTNFGSVEGLRLVNQHVCRQSPSAFSRREVIAAVKRAAISDFGWSSTDIVSAAKRNLTDYELLSLPTDRGLQDRAQRRKKPIGANSVDKPVNEIVWLQYFRQTERNDVFLRHDSRLSEPDLPFFFLFLSGSGLQLLQESSCWSIDGIFFSTPPQFAQLYTVNVFRCESTLPCAYALLPDKTAGTYSRLFNVLKDFHLQPQNVMTDFEIAAINALEDVFENVDVDFCLFHLFKNAFANVQKKNLHAAYENGEARALLRCLPALAFLPVTDVSSSFDEVKIALMEMRLFKELHLENNLREYLNYFEKTYVRRRVRGVQTEGLFPIACWNCNAAAVNCLPRTNNAIEGWHKGFNARFRKAHMNLSQFIIRLKAEEEKTRQMIVRARVNPAEILRQARPQYVKREANLKVLVQRYQPSQEVEFLKAIQSHLAKFSCIQQNEIYTEAANENLAQI